MLDINDMSFPSRRYSYYIIKPDGIRFLDKIINELTEYFKSSSIKFFKIDDYSSIQKKLHYKLYDKHPDSFPEIMDSNMRGVNCIYGNEGILILLSEFINNKQEYTNFLDKISKFKEKIRNETMNNDTFLFTRLSNDSKLTGERIINFQGELRRVDIPGTLSRIHCSDHCRDDIYNDLKILLDSGIISNKNMLGPDDINHAKSYASIAGFNSSRGSDEPRPDIAGFVAGEIWNKEINENNNELIK